MGEIFLSLHMKNILLTFNRKGWHSQVTVNHLGMFIDIYVGWPGSVHNARDFPTQVYTRSDFYSRID